MKTAYDIIIKPVITEQSMEQTEAKKYVFQVAIDANKSEIKKAIEQIFGVKVEKVKMCIRDSICVLRFLKRVRRARTHPAKERRPSGASRGICRSI